MAKKKTETTIEEQTCFVVIGFGKKTDFATGRMLNLDLTYQKLIKPAFDEVGVRCFRAIDVNVTGSIDKLMYRWIYQADFVVADLSTMNANVFYELGVRHAQRPNTTLIMAENGLFSKLPFDLSHTIIYGYEHLGEEIAEEEAKRFVGLLSGQLQKLLKDPVSEDSPVYTYLPGMNAPTWTDPKELIAELQAKLAEQEKLAAEMGTEGAPAIDPEALKKQSLGMLVKSAEAAKNREDFATAIALFKAATENDKQDMFVWQRLVLVTYKQSEDNKKEVAEENDAAIAHLREAEQLLIDNCELYVSTDPETLGLAGAINKRLYERTEDLSYFEKSVFYYERGFYIKQDYYNGINVAYMYTLKAAEMIEGGRHYDAIVNYGHGRMIRKKVADICEGLVANRESFNKRGDKQWIYQTLAQAYLGMGERDKAEALMPEIQKFSEGKFDMSTFLEQNQKLVDAMETFESRVEIPSGDGKPAAARPAKVDRAPAAAVSQGPISIAPELLHDKPIRSIEVTCKIEYA